MNQIKEKEDTINNKTINDSQNNINDFTLFSGAAPGADTEWSKIGKEFGLSKTRDYLTTDMEKLTIEQSSIIEDAYKKVVTQLGRKFLSASTYVGKLVRRDYLQAKSADQIFAISTIDFNKNTVNGGTGYAVQMAINMNKPVHVFDQNLNKWFTYKEGKFIEETTPQLTKNFADIGTREINDSGKQAIREVYTKTFNTLSESKKSNKVEHTIEYVEDTNVDDLLSLDLTNPINKIAQAMSHVERKARAESIASLLKALAIDSALAFLSTGDIS